METIELFDLQRRVQEWKESHWYRSQSFKEKEKWLDLTRKYEIIVFYNTGKHLFVQEGDYSADSLWYLPWKWVKYREFSDCKFFMRQKSRPKNLISLKHHGHDHNGDVGLTISWREGLIYDLSPEKRLRRFHLYYVCIRKGRPFRRLDQRVPLPISLFNLNPQDLEPIII